MDLGLRGRVAVVCAASQGLGRAVAEEFVREGAHVVICSRDARRLAAAAKDIRAFAAGGAGVLDVAADLTKPQHIRRLFRAALRSFGRIDILVTNAGGPPVAAFADLDDRTWQRGIDLNLMSTIRCIREALPVMRKQHWGRIVNITSVTAKQPIDDLVISSTVRPGILGLSKVLANQFTREGILVNSVAPGFILTDRQKEIGASRAKAAGITQAEYIEKMGKGIPAGRLGTPQELAGVIVFLSSERASYISGTTVNVDGGLMKGII
ncbi:MAG TPA: SDR family oxidoreductase [Bacteroidota bacterium]|nr:SDR family oxidoreductase [Bacteroidota bacterium]